MRATSGEPRWFKGTWDGALNPGYTIADYNRLERLAHGALRRLAVWVFEDDRFVLAYDQRDMHRVGAAIVARLRRDPGHLGRTRAALLGLERAISMDAARLPALAAAARAGTPAGVRLAGVHDRLHDAFARVFGVASLCEPCGVHVHSAVSARLGRRFGPETAPVYQARLTQPTFASWAQREALARRSLAAAVAALPARRRTEARLPASLRHALAAHARRYGFLRHSYLGTADTTVTCLLADIRADLADATPADTTPPAALAAAARRDRDRLVAAYRLDEETRFLLRTLDALAHLQDERKRVVLSALAPLDAALRAAARLAEEPADRLRLWLPEEVSAFLRDGVRPAAARLAARASGCAVVTRDGVRRLVEAPGAVRRWRERITRLPAGGGLLAGTTASRGVATGRARVLLSVGEVGRVRRGDVLVAGNTTPDYMPALRRAAAVLAEKGGLTSHAALIARELGIPCLVGVAQVTRRVADGAHVQVDGDRGVATVLSR
jgi:phosphohistidine swiveling domain-containing protein